MDEREGDRVLGERVEIDDAYLGGVHPGKVGRGAAGKVQFERGAAVGIATAFVGFVVIFPVLGYATWHSYRALVK